MPIEYIEAKSAASAIRKMLMGNGGTATVTVGNSIRLLFHTAIDRPLTTLPWLLKLLQPRTFRYRVYESNELLEETDFDKSSVDVAISKLLNNVAANDQVTLRPE
jgi:hypothetical protein